MEGWERKHYEAKRIIQEWVDKQGHERCWYYPELFKELADLFEIEQTEESKLPPLREFEAGCKRYQKEEYEKGNS